MQKYFFFILIACISGNLAAQRSIDSLVQAEKNFANTCLSASIKEGFLKFIDTGGVVFQKGVPVNGFKLYTNSEKTPGILTWEPEYAEITASNDFGYTTGPWNYYSKEVKDNPIARGQYITVWHLTDKGQWKLLIDFGISYSNERKTTSLEKSEMEKPVQGKDNKGSLEEAESKFTRSYTINGAQSYRSFLSSDSRLNYAGFLPAATEAERQSLLDSLPNNIKYTVVGSGISPGKDLGYVYGTTDNNNKQDGFLRIWRKEKNGWKIAVEVLHFKP